MMAAQNTSHTFRPQTTTDQAKANPDRRSSDEETVVHPAGITRTTKKPTKRITTTTTAIAERRILRRKSAANGALEDKRLTTALAKRVQALFLSERRELHKANAQLQVEAEGSMTELMFARKASILDPLRRAVNPEFDVADAKRTTSSLDFLMM